jgi:hypothetical protein
MCSIIGSFNKDKIKELVLINQHRGNFSYSISSGDINIKEFGSFDTGKLNSIKTSEYILCHVQAPTGGLIESIDRIHPVEFKGTKLWHNGILLSKQIQQFQSELNDTSTFDTYLMCKKLYQSDNWAEELSNIDGLFTCVYYRDNNYYIFRTKHGKLFVDDYLNISSEKFENSKCINYNTVYTMDFNNNNIKFYDKFKTKSFNIVVPGEM